MIDASALRLVSSAWNEGMHRGSRPRTPEGNMPDENMTEENMAEPLVSIGDFSRMTYLTVKALRYYHEAGILVPWTVDASSGYRSYHVSQVPTAQVIRRLRDLDMPLDDVREVVAAPDVDSRNRAISAHLKRMEEQLSQTKATVSSLRTLLQAPRNRADVVTFSTAPEQWVLKVHEVVDFADAGAWAGPAFGELYAAVDALGCTRTGVDGALFYAELFEQGHGELVAFVPVDGPVDVRAAAAGAAGSAGSRADAFPRVASFHVTGTELAVMVHHGSGADIDRTYGALGSIVAERAIGVAGPIRENFLVTAADTADESQHRTEVCWPVFRTRA
jgi:DNA-binding transcriptional MerR regulator/effector-binding domain-containing protein